MLLTPKLYLSIVVLFLCTVVLSVSPTARDVQQTQLAWNSLFSRSDNSLTPALKFDSGALPTTLQVGASYHNVSTHKDGSEDSGFDNKIMSFIETSKARSELLIATIEQTPTLAEKCKTNTTSKVCVKIQSIMLDAVTTSQQAELAVESYKLKGNVADPLLEALQQNIVALKALSSRYPGIGPIVE